MTSSGQPVSHRHTRCYDQYRSQKTCFDPREYQLKAKSDQDKGHGNSFPNLLPQTNYELLPSTPEA